MKWKETAIVEQTELCDFAGFIVFFAAPRNVGAENTRAKGRSSR